MVDWRMETIPITKFKATCFAVLERVRRTGKPILVTRFGEPIAKIGPPTPNAVRPEWVGVLAGTAVLHDDLIASAVEPGEWEP